MLLFGNRIRLVSLRIVLAAMIVTTVSLSLQGATYYVSQSTGNDEWSGGEETNVGKAGPWKTLAAASKIVLMPGDKVLLKCGDVWNEELTPQGNGTPEKPILISTYGAGAKPIIDQKDYKKDRMGIRLHNQEGYKIVGIEFANCMTGIFADYSTGSPTRKYIWIEDCYFRDSLLYGHYEDYPKRKIGLGICFFSHETAKKIVLSDITIKNCVFRRLASGVWTNSPDNFNKNASFVYNFANMTFEDCLFEEGFQWQMGIRGVDGGRVKNCVTHDVGRGFRSFNGVAGAMFFRCKDWVFEDSEWGFVDIGNGSGDGEAFDFEGNCDNMVMKNCLFHDTDGPGFLLCCYASDGNPNRGILMERCVLNGKAKRPIGLARCEIINTTDWNEAHWKDCRFYLSKGEILMKVADPEKDKRSSFESCIVKNLSQACSAGKLKGKVTSSTEKGKDGASLAVLEMEFAEPSMVTEFRLKEAANSSVSRYVIHYWDEKESQWKSCFNGGAIGADFVAPIVARTTKKVRLTILGCKKDAPVIDSFEAFNDTTGAPLNVPRGSWPDVRPGI